MRVVFALGLFVAMCASAEAAAVNHSNARHHAGVRHAYGMMPRLGYPPSQGLDPRFPPVIEDQTPSYDDPSKRGGA
jgi:hypothetical protein